MLKKMSSLGLFLVLVLAAYGMLFMTTGCDESSGESGVAKIDGFAAAWTTTNYLDDTYGVLMAAKSGEAVFARVQTDGNGEQARLSQVVYQTADGRQAVIYLGYDGLPIYLVDSDYVFYFVNYTETTVDVYRMDRAGNEEEFLGVESDILTSLPDFAKIQIEGIRSTIPLNADLQALVRMAADGEEDGGITFGQIITMTKFVLGGVGCGVAIVAAAPTVVGGLAVAGACGSVLLDLLEEMGLVERPALLNDVEQVLSVTGCLTGGLGDCAALILEGLQLGYENADEFIEWYLQATGRAVSPGRYQTSASRTTYGPGDYTYGGTGGFELTPIDGGFRIRAANYVFVAHYTGMWQASATVYITSDCWWTNVDEEGNETITDRHVETHSAGTSINFSQNSIRTGTYNLSTCYTDGSRERWTFTKL